jgi:hypothetical protein
MFLPTATGSRFAVYYLGKDAPAHGRIDGTPSPLFIDHQLAINDVRLAFQSTDASTISTTRWSTEHELRAMRFGVVPDGYIEYVCAGRLFAAFVEVDRATEPLKRLQEKARAYVDLAFSGRFEATFAHPFFRVLVTTPTQARMNAVASAVGRVTDRMFRVAVHQRLCTEGPFACIWRSARDPTLQSLI